MQRERSGGRQDEWFFKFRLIANEAGAIIFMLD